jgi:mRNA interferase RelE/StbE
MKIVVTDRARKDFLNLDKTTRIRIRAEINKMAVDMASVDIKKLKGYEDRWRLRIGDYRVLFQISLDEITAIALRVKHRREAY